MYTMTDKIGQRFIKRTMEKYFIRSFQECEANLIVRRLGLIES